MVVLPPIALKGLHGEKDGTKFAYIVDRCDVNYIANYNLVCHLQAHHNVIVELGKLERPSIWEEGPLHQGHAIMNVQVLNNTLTQFHHNKQKATAKAKGHANLEWGRL